eukprot:6109937-Pleurochrysis_carterae.AAC.1
MPWHSIAGSIHDCLILVRPYSERFATRLYNFLNDRYDASNNEYGRESLGGTFHDSYVCLWRANVRGYV